MMKFQITSMTPEERLYAYSQSSQIEGQTGCIGYLRGDFGAGQEFYTSWFDRRKEYKDGEFKAEFDEVVNIQRLNLRGTTAPSMVLRCKRPSTPICCGVISTMEIITFTSTPTLPGF